jgi:hypothetical protein
MAERIRLPQKIVDGIGLGRSDCQVEIWGIGEKQLVKCSRSNQRTSINCRSLIDTRDPNYFHGCPLRDTSKPSYVLERHGIIVQIEN